MNRFRLLRLPYTALIEVLRTMSVMDLFTFSHCSKRSYNLVPLSKSKNFSVIVRYGRQMTIEIAGTTFKLFPEDQWVRDPDLVEFFSRHLKSYVWIDEADNKMFTYYPDVSRGMTKMGIYLLDLFKCKVECFEYSNGAWWVMDFIREIVKRQQQIEELLILSDIRDEDFKWIMDNLKITDKVYWNSRQGQQFSYTFKHLPVKLFIYQTHWFTLQNLLHIENCKLLKLNHSHLTNEDIAQFIDHWKSGALPELEYFQMNNVRRMSEEQPIGKLAVFTAFTGDREKTVDGETVDISNGVEIDGNDGRTKALLSFTRSSLKFFVCRDTDFLFHQVLFD